MSFQKLFILFIIYSVIGYIYEIVVLLVVEKKIIIKRGFMFGPYIPIYGLGMFIMAFLLNGLSNNILLLFIASLISAGTLEYLTSYIMEKIYGYRWWDYTYSKYNINGRVTLEILFMFGIDGILVVKLINPFFINIINNLSNSFINVCFATLFIVFIIDFCVSAVISFKIKEKVNIIASKDSTQIIKDETRNYIKKLVFGKI